MSYKSKSTKPKKLKPRPQSIGDLVPKTAVSDHMANKWARVNCVNGHLKYLD